MIVDVIATEAHFRDHLAPIRDALPQLVRGRVVTDPELAGVGRAGRWTVALVASYGDHKRARLLGYERIVRAEHGAGQSYGGDPASADVANYAGGLDADDVSLFLVPGPHPAMRWRARYTAPVAEVGCPKLDSLPALDGPPGAIALSFHGNASIGASEADGAFRWYRSLIGRLARRFDLVGHAHPRYAHVVRPWFRRNGVPFVETFAEVCRRASVYAVDNSSTLFEFAATGRPVVVLDGPHYRRDVDHGLRFWAAAGVGVRAQPATVEDAIARALEDDESDRRGREAALDLVYAYRTGAAERAAAAVMSWLESRKEVAA